MSNHLDDLLRCGRISSVPVTLGPRDNIFRRMFWTTECEQWCMEIIGSQPHQPSKFPYDQQLNQAFADFVTGRPLTGMTKCDPPKGQALWRIKTPDLRLYGWAPAQQTLILCCAELKSVLKKPGPPKDKDLGNRVVAQRKDLGLNKPVYGEIYDVFPQRLG